MSFFNMRFLNFIIGVLLVATAIFGIYHIVILFSNINDPSNAGSGKPITESPPPSPVMECNNNVTSSEPCYGLVMITRNEWLAQPSHKPIDKLDLPAKKIILTDTNTQDCSKKSKCIYIVRNIQGNHMLLKDDIKYNFLINTQGDIYEGRGWTLQSAEEDDDLKAKSYWIAVIGNFTDFPVWEKQVQGVRLFAQHAISAGKLSSSYEIYCSRDILFIEPSNVKELNGSNYRECFDIK